MPRLSGLETIERMRGLSGILRPAPNDVGWAVLTESAPVVGKVHPTAPLPINRIALPEIDFSVVCSKGFYVRTYVHDIGDELGCGAHLKSLRRLKSGRFDVDQAISVSQIKNASREDILNRILSLPEVSRMRGA